DVRLVQDEVVQPWPGPGARTRRGARTGRVEPIDRLHEARAQSGGPFERRRGVVVAAQAVEQGMTAQRRRVVEVAQRALDQQAQRRTSPVGVPGSWWLRRRIGRG